MSLAQLKDQAAHLEIVEQRELLAFLVSLQTGLDGLDARQPRPSGLCAGEFVTPADFDDPLPNDLLREFEGV